MKFANRVEAQEFQDAYANMTDYDWLQCNKGQAEIHMMALAEARWDAYNESIPKQLKAGEWHIPFVDGLDLKELDNHIQGRVFSGDALTDLKIKVATARCAQVSYTVVGEDGKEMDYAKLIALHDRLLKAGHMSPFEHCAQAPGLLDHGGFLSCSDYPLSNFNGFIQYRKTIKGENIV